MSLMLTTYILLYIIGIVAAAAAFLSFSHHDHHHHQQPQPSSSKLTSSPSKTAATQILPVSLEINHRQSQLTFSSFLFISESEGHVTKNHEREREIIVM